MASQQAELTWLATMAQLVLAAVATAAALSHARDVMIPFVLALLMSALVLPLIDDLQVRLRTPRVVAIPLALVLICAAFVLLALLLFASAQGVIANADVYLERVQQLALQAAEIPLTYGIDFGQEELARALTNLPLLSMVTDTANGILHFLSNSFLVLIFAIYLVSGREPLQRRADIWGEAEARVRRYLATKVTTSAATGMVTALVLWGLGLELSVVFGTLAFLLNFIPSIGSVIATLLPLPMALVQFHSPWMVAMAVVLPGTAQFVIGNIIEPRMMGESLDLHPVTVLLSLVFWGMLWGVTGMLLAAPIMAVLKIVLERFDTTRPFSELLAGRLPDTIGPMEDQG